MHILPVAEASVSSATHVNGHHHTFPVIPPTSYSSPTSSLDPLDDWGPTINTSQNNPITTSPDVTQTLPPSPHPRASSSSSTMPKQKSSLIFDGVVIQKPPPKLSKQLSSSRSTHSVSRKSSVIFDGVYLPPLPKISLLKASHKVKPKQSKHTQKNIDFTPSGNTTPQSYDEIDFIQQSGTTSPHPPLDAQQDSRTRFRIGLGTEIAINALSHSGDDVIPTWSQRWQDMTRQNIRHLRDTQVGNAGTRAGPISREQVTRAFPHSSRSEVFTSLALEMFGPEYLDLGVARKPRKVVAAPEHSASSGSLSSTGTSEPGDRDDREAIVLQRTQMANKDGRVRSAQGRLVR